MMTPEHVRIINNRSLAIRQCRLDYDEFSSINLSNMNRIYQYKDQFILKKDKLNHTMLGGEKFSDYLWEKAKSAGYIDAGLQTQFIQQIKTGTLNPQIYGIFMIQDYDYQEEAAILFQRAFQLAEQSQDIQTMQLVQPFRDKYRKRADQHFKNWRIKKDAIIRSPACEDFIRVGRQCLQKYGSKYVFILQYACRKLWPDLANQIRHHIPIEQNAYRFWIQRYQYEEPEKKMSKILDQYYEKGLLEEQLCWELLERTLICDINLFKEAFDEKFLEYHPKGINCTEIITEGSEDSE